MVQIWFDTDFKKHFQGMFQSAFGIDVSSLHAIYICDSNEHLQYESKLKKDLEQSTYLRSLYELL